MKIDIREYITDSERRPFTEWLEDVDSKAALKISTAISRMQSGNFSNVKGVGSGVFECKIDFGPGYRVYFGKDGEKIVILLGGGTKKRQQHDINTAHDLWQKYKKQKDSQTWH